MLRIKLFAVFISFLLVQVTYGQNSRNQGEAKPGNAPVRTTAVKPSVNKNRPVRGNQPGAGSKSSIGNTPTRLEPNNNRTVPATRPIRIMPPNTRTGNTPLPTGDNHNTGYFPAYYYDNGYNPYFYNSYMNMLSLGAGIMYTPNYGEYYSSGAVANNDNYYNNGSGGVVLEKLEGFVVYAFDTLRGSITLDHNSISLEKTDSGRNYDYKFKPKQKHLTCVSVNNEDNKHLELVRIKNDENGLYRIVHEGRLNIYDEKHDFIYQPDDIDIRNLVVVYNGKPIYLKGSSMTVDEIKERLVGLVNSAYESKLNASKINWNELLIYIDKLD